MRSERMSGSNKRSRRDHTSNRRNDNKKERKKTKSQIMLESKYTRPRTAVKLREIESPEVTTTRGGHKIKRKGKQKSKHPILVKGTFEHSRGLK